MRISGPNYTVKDLVYYIGFLGGIGGTVALLRPYGFHPILVFIAGLVVGGVLGWVFERSYVLAQRRKADRYYDDWDTDKRRDDDHR